MKRIIAILLICFMCFNLPVGGFAADKAELPVDFVAMVNTLNGLGILESAELSQESYTRTVSRGEFSKHILALIKVQEYEKGITFADMAPAHNYAEALVTAYKMGLLLSENGKIRPDDAITCGEALQAAVTLLGAATVPPSPAVSQNDYIRQAVKMEIVRKYLPGKNTLTYAQFVEILYNSLLAETAYIIPDQEELVEGNCLLSSCWGLSMDEGFVTANQYYSLTEKTGTQSPVMIINGQSYKVEDYIDIECVGLMVRYFYNKSGTIVAIEKKRHEKEVISSLDLINMPSLSTIRMSGGRIEYYDEDKDKCTLSLSNEAYVLKNYETALPSEVAIPQNGEIILLDYNNDKLFDVLLINDYTELVMSQKNEETGFIMGKGGKNITFDKDTILVYKNGVIGSLADITPGKTLSACCDDEGIARVIYVAEGAVEGMLSEISDEDITIRGRSYRLSGAFRRDYVIKLNDSGIFYLNHKGEIAYFVSDDTSFNYGYLMAIGADGVVSRKVLMKVLTKDDGIIIFNVKDKVKYNGASTDAQSMMSEVAVSGINGSCEQLIRYRVNADNMITTLETAQPNGYGITQTSDRLHMSAESVSDGFGAKIVQGDTTVMFNVPEIPGSDDSLYFATTTMTGSHVKYTAYSVRRYQMTPSVIIGYTAGGYTAGGIGGGPAGEIDYSLLPAIVTKVDYARNRDGEFAKRVTLLQENSWPAQQEEHKYIVADNSAWETNRGEEGTTTQNGDNLNVGDVIMYSLNTVGEIGRINRVYNGLTQTIDSEHGTITEFSNYDYFGSPFRLLESYAFKTEDNYLMVSKVSINGSEPDEENLEIYKFDYERVLLVEKDGTKVTVKTGTMADIRSYENYGSECDKILVNTQWKVARTIIAIRSDVF